MEVDTKMDAVLGSPVPRYRLRVITHPPTPAPLIHETIGEVWRSGTLPSCYRWWFTPTEEFIAMYRAGTGSTWPPIRSCRTRREVTDLVVELLEETKWREPEEPEEVGGWVVEPADPDVGRYEETVYHEASSVCAIEFSTHAANGKATLVVCACGETYNGVEEL